MHLPTDTLTDSLLVARQRLTYTADRQSYPRLVTDHRTPSPIPTSPIMSPVLLTHRRRWLGWHLLHSVRRTRGPSSHPWWQTGPPHYHTVSRWACLPRSAQTRASFGCASPHHWGPRHWDPRHWGLHHQGLLPGPQCYSQDLQGDCRRKLQFSRAHKCLPGPQPEAKVVGGWLAGPRPWILKGSPEWLISC